MTDYITRVLYGPYAGQPFTNPQPAPLSPDTADFRDYGDRSALATLGIFSSDRAANRLARWREAAYEAGNGAVYAAAGLNRRREHAKIASRIAHLTPEGIWPQSTGLYARLCRQRDLEVAELLYETHRSNQHA